MRWFISRFFLVIIFYTYSFNCFSQNGFADTIGDNAAFKNAVNLYHQFLSPETGLYNGSEYAYKLHYPFTINEGHPFYMTKQFDTGAVFYNNVLYENVPLLYDLVKDELLTKDPTNAYTIKLNSENIEWFIILNNVFFKITKDSADNSALHTGFYNVLYNGNTAVYKKLSKNFKDNTASFQGLNRYVYDINEYFIKKDNQFYKLKKNKKSLLTILNNKRKEIEQFIRKNKLNLKKNKDYSLTKIMAYYDGINNNSTQRIN